MLHVQWCVRGLQVAVGDFRVITQLPLRKGGASRQCLCPPVCTPISQDREERKEGVTWQNSTYYKIAGVHFISTWPCQGHHCLPGLLETWCYWTKAAAPQRHTQQLFLYHLMTCAEDEAAHDCHTSSLRVTTSTTSSQFHIQMRPRSSRGRV